MDGLHDRIIKDIAIDDPLYMLKVSKGNKFIGDKPENEVKYAYDIIEEKKSDQDLIFYL